MEINPQHTTPLKQKTMHQTTTPEAKNQPRSYPISRSTKSISIYDSSRTMRKEREAKQLCEQEEVKRKTHMRKEKEKIAHKTNNLTV